MILDLVQGGDMEGFRPTSCTPRRRRRRCTLLVLILYRMYMFLSRSLLCVHTYVHAYIFISYVQGGDMEGFQANFMHTAPSQAQVHNSSSSKTVYMHSPNSTKNKTKNAYRCKAETWRGFRPASCTPRLCRRRYATVVHLGLTPIRVTLTSFVHMISTSCMRVCLRICMYLCIDVCIQYVYTYYTYLYFP